MWDKKRLSEYWNLKRLGYTEEMLKEHFGDDIYQSGIYKRVHILPKELFYKINEEIKINTIETQYTFIKTKSIIYKNKYDFLINFNCNGVIYILYLMYYEINNVDTYNVIFTTNSQWMEYQLKLSELTTKGLLTSDEHKILDNIIGRETNYHDIFNVFKCLSYVLLNFYKKYIKNIPLSIGETDNEKKIKVYRNIIKDSFSNIEESEEFLNGNKYYIYKINEF